jgi:hypothetical protein
VESLSRSKIEASKKQLVARLKAVGLGLLAFVFFVLLSIGFAGAGHGTYLPAKLLFPYSMLLPSLRGNAITGPLIAVATIQFPAYFLIIQGTRKYVWWVLASIHFTLAILCILADTAGVFALVPTTAR